MYLVEQTQVLEIIAGSTNFHSKQLRGGSNQNDMHYLSDVLLISCILIRRITCQPNNKMLWPKKVFLQNATQPKLTCCTDRICQTHNIIQVALYLLLWEQVIHDKSKSKKQSKKLMAWCLGNINMLRSRQVDHNSSLINN